MADELEQKDDFTPDDEELLQSLLGAKFQRFDKNFEARKGKAGRPTDLTDALIERFLIPLRQGAYIETCCMFAGIARTTFYRWMKKANDVESKLEAIEAKVEEARQNDAVYQPTGSERSLMRYAERDDIKRLRRFSYIVQVTQSEQETRDLMHISRAAAAGNWGAAAWRLTRKHPERWGDRTTTDVNVKGEVGFKYVEVAANADGDGKLPAESPKALSDGNVLEPEIVPSEDEDSKIM